MAEGGEERLPDLYEKIWSCWETLDSTEEPSSSYNVQVQKKTQQEQKTNKHCLKMIEHAREIQIEDIHLIAKQVLFKTFRPL